MWRTKIISVLIFCFFLQTISFAQRGKDGPRTVSAANTLVNEYTTLTTNAVAGTASVTVAISTLNANGRFTANLAAGDLIMIIQMQGVTINSNNNFNYGRISTYNNCGNYEFAEVTSVPNGTTINIRCGLKFNYTSAGRVQVVRVPRWTALTVNNGGVLTCDTWNGSIGGVLAVEVNGNTVINTGGSISATGKGFRGAAESDNSSYLSVGDHVSADLTWGGDKGEGVVGFSTDYDLLGGRSCRGAAGNAGGGGNAHNCGAGGGANAGDTAAWNSAGNPDPNAGYIAAWNLETPPLAGNVSTGGGRGGYASSSATQNPLTLGPNNAAWGGDSRKENGGFGGRPLDYSTGRLFLGGGGGSGDQDGGLGGLGGNGGGMIYILSYGSVTGAGSIVSNGNNGGNSVTAACATTDAAGGAGGGGTIVLNSTGNISGISATANGGTGGSQLITVNLFCPNSHAEGPGGGGGGGYIAYSAGTPTCTANGGNNGTTNAATMANFPPNGATRGGAGINNATITNFIINAPDVNICTGNTATLTATLVGTVPGGTVINWYNAAVNGTLLGTGGTFTTPVLFGNTTYYVGTCPGIYTQAVNVIVNPSPMVTVTPNPASFCAGGSVVLTASGATTYYWAPAAGLSATTGSVVTANPGSNTTYTITGTTAGCTGTVSVPVTVIALPIVSVTPNPASFCAGGSVVLTASGAASYSWAPAGGLSATTGSVVTANPGSNTTYTISGTTAGCTGTIAVPVSVISIPVVSVTPNPVSICAGDSVLLTASGATTYSWAPALGLSATTGSVVTADPSSSTTYSITGTTSGCTGTTSVTVNVIALPIVNVTPNPATICAGDSVILTASGATTYSWTPALGLSSTSGAVISASPSAMTIYTITGTSGLCSNTGTVIVNVNPKPVMNVNPSMSTFCAGDSVILTASGATTYSWSPTTGLSSTSGAIVTADPMTSTNYTITGATAGCSSTTLAVITVNPIPIVSVTPSPATICTGNSVVLTASGAASYNWAPATGLSATTGSMVTANPVTTTTYTITGTSLGCTGTTSVIITVVPAIVATVNNDTTICAGSSVNLLANGGAGYSWSPGTGLSCTNCANPIATPASTTTYTVTVSSGTCTPATATITITVIAIPVLSFNPPSPTICSGDSITITASGATTYVWSPATGLNTTNGSVVNAGPASSTTYTITGTSSVCSSTGTVTVSVTSAIVANAGNDTSFCAGSSVQLNATGGTSYAWSPALGLSCTNCANPIANTTSTTTYTVTVSSGTCTPATAQITVTVDPVPVITVNPISSVICNGSSDTLTASGATSYNWSPATGLNTTTGSVVYANPSTTTTYTVSGTTGGCTASTTVLVTVTAGIIADAGPDTSICIGGSIILTASGGNNYAWSPAAGLSCTNCASPTANPATTTTYTVTVSSGTCVPATDQVTVTIVNPPVPSISGNTTICSGTPTTLTASGGSTYQWSTTQTSSSITVSPTLANTYTVTVSNGACTASAMVTVNVNPAPVITAGTDTTIILGQSVSLWSTGGISYNWSPITGLSCANCPNPIATPTETTVYYVTGTDSIGCTSIDTVMITIDMQCGDVFVPNAFSPNGDGVNDVLLVHGNCIKSMKFSIFDRWGERVFECEDPKTGWDGKKNGLPMNSGVFVYYLRADMIDKTTVKKQGNITLFR